jgi:hypothetical protein
MGNILKKTLICALAVTAGLTTQAYAQSNGSDWSGFYAGAGYNLGGVSNISVAELSAVGPTNGTLGRNELSQFNAVAGYTWDFGTYTLSGELQLLGSSPSGLDGPARWRPDVCPLIAQMNCADASVLSTIDPTFRVRAVGGYEVQDRTVLLGAIGIASANVTYNGVSAIATDGGNRQETVGPFGQDGEAGTVQGLSLGLGVEHRVTDAFSIRAFVNHDIYESFAVSQIPRTASATGNTNTATATVTDSIDYTTTTLELGFLFGF